MGPMNGACRASGDAQGDQFVKCDLPQNQRFVDEVKNGRNGPDRKLTR
jgi:hypothetical protein